MQTLSPAQDAAPDPQPGTRIDDFTIAYRLARGMNADVFAVWHHTLHTPLVCKRLRPADGSDAKWRRLLRAEGAALARLNHPGIVRLVAQQQTAPLPYLLLEHVGALTLRDRLRRQGPLPVELAVRVVQHVGAAVGYAHARGYLHRDLKPSNIIMRAGRPVLLDFGVVWRWTGVRRPPDRAGTPQYLAPEQIRRSPLTPRTDVYGLGLLLFELLTGQRPFRAGPRAHDRRAPLSARYPQLHEPPLTLAQAGGGHVAHALAHAITRCLQPDPAARFASVAALLAALDPHTEVKIWPADVRGTDSDFAPFCAADPTATR